MIYLELPLVWLEPFARFLAGGKLTDDEFQAIETIITDLEKGLRS